MFHSLGAGTYFSIEMGKRIILLLCVLPGVLTWLAGCRLTPVEQIQPLEDGVLATFQVETESFKVWVTNPDAIRKLMEIWNGLTDDDLPNAPVRRGAGEGDHNDPWTWHLDPEEVYFYDTFNEVCDGLPSDVERNVEGRIRGSGRYCPGVARLVKLEDFR